jgi:hypothetical protein
MTCYGMIYECIKTFDGGVNLLEVSLVTSLVPKLAHKLACKYTKLINIFVFMNETVK